MKQRYILILAIFFLFVGPGPALFFVNKYTVALMPLLCLTAILYLLKDEIYGAGLDSVLKNRDTYRWAFLALKYAIFAQALSTIIFRPSGIVTDSILSSYLIAPFYIIVAGPIFEEVAYRKIIFGYLDSRFNFWTGATVSSAIFAVGHLSPPHLLGYFVTGMVFCYAFKKSGSIVPTLLAHSALNFMSILATTLKG